MVARLPNAKLPRVRDLRSSGGYRKLFDDAPTASCSVITQDYSDAT
jgi:hypothetical protein